MAKQLAKRGSPNPHWRPQSAFCGGLGRTWRGYTTIVPFPRAVAGIADVLDARATKEAQRGVVRRLRDQAGLAHVDTCLSGSDG